MSSSPGPGPRFSGPGLWDPGDPVPDADPCLRSFKPKSNSCFLNSTVFKYVLINAQKMEYVKMVHANVTQIGQVKIAQ